MVNPHAVIAGAAFDLLGFISVDMAIISADEHERMLKSLQRWAATRQINLLDADVQNWRKQISSNL